MKWKEPVIMCAAMIALSGCNQNTQPGTEPNTDTNAAPATGAVQEEGQNSAMTHPTDAAQSKEGYLASSGQKLKEINAKLDDFAAKAGSLTGQAKVQADQSLVTLREERDKAAARLKELQQTTATAWTEVKAGFESAIEEFEKAYEDAKAGAS